MHPKRNFSNLLLDKYDYGNWFMKPDEKDLIDLSRMLSLDSDDEVKEGKGLKI